MFLNKAVKNNHDINTMKYSSCPADTTMEPYSIRKWRLLNKEYFRGISFRKF